LESVKTAQRKGMTKPDYTIQGALVHADALHYVSGKCHMAAPVSKCDNIRAPDNVTSGSSGR
jgi:hypothetical protein